MASPYITAPSSPIHLADAHIHLPESPARLAFDWDHQIPKSFGNDITFEFCVDQFQSFSLPAEELFDDGKIRTLKPPPPIQRRQTTSPPPSTNQSIWSSRRSYDKAGPRNQRGTKTTSFAGSKTSRFNRLINLLSFRRTPSSQRPSSTTSFGSTATSSSSSGLGSVSGYSTVRYFSGSVHESGDGYGATRDEVKSCLTPCKQRIMSCFVKKL